MSRQVAMMDALWRVLYENSAFRKKNPKYNVGFKNMPKLVRLEIGGNGCRCERWLLANLKAGFTTSTIEF